MVSRRAPVLMRLYPIMLSTLLISFHVARASEEGEAGEEEAEEDEIEPATAVLFPWYVPKMLLFRVAISLFLLLKMPVLVHLPKTGSARSWAS